MVRIRNKRTLVEKNVPERAVPYFPDWEVVTPKTEASAEENKPRSRGSKAEAESSDNKE